VNRPGVLYGIRLVLAASSVAATGAAYLLFRDLYPAHKLTTDWPIYGLTAMVPVLWILIGTVLAGRDGNPAVHPYLTVVVVATAATTAVVLGVMGVEYVDGLRDGPPAVSLSGIVGCLATLLVLYPCGAAVFLIGVAEWRRRAAQAEGG
jgi:hypothetical protein